MIQVKCPAAELQFPVLAPDLAVECRVVGNLRPARKFPNPMQTKGDKVVCCADYSSCPVWKSHRQTMEREGTVAIQNTMRNQRSGHTLDNAERDKVRI